MFSILSTIVSAQDIVISGGAEITVGGNQFGGAVMYETKKAWGAGPFYQAGISRHGAEKGLKNPFYGVALQAPIIISKRISFFATVRTGLVNAKFLVIVPSLDTRIDLTPKTGFSVGAGLRSGYPSFAAKIFAKLF